MKVPYIFTPEFYSNLSDTDLAMMLRLLNDGFDACDKAGGMQVEQIGFHTIAKKVSYEQVDREATLREIESQTSLFQLVGV